MNRFVFSAGVKNLIYIKHHNVSKQTYIKYLTTSRLVLLRCYFSISIWYRYDIEWV